MKKSILAIMVLFICTITSYGQSAYTIKGVTVDTVEKNKIPATITLVNAKDSILRRFTHTDANGAFSLSGLPAGKFTLWISNPDYADYLETFTLDVANPTHNFGNISMLLRLRLLKEVQIKGTPIAVRIKGDTSIYDAKAYVIQPNDKVEDLLKQLPDVQVDKDGKITAQGVQVKNVLLDGEKFFGDDPLLVTRNIRADMVDKMQIYDKKSDQATFTGIDDGKKEKTINITLKQDKKTGVFGKVNAGIGNDDYYEGQAMFNKFKAKYKLSAYATTANDGKNTIGAADNNRLGGSSSNLVSFDDAGGGGIIIISGLSGGDELDNGTYNNRGLPSARTAGVHFDTKLNADKATLNTNYKIGSLGLTTDQNTHAEQSLVGTTQITNSDKSTYAHTFRQKADLSYQNTPNASTNYRIVIDGTLKDIDSQSSLISRTDNDAGSLVSRNNQTTKSNGEQKAFNASFIYNKRFKKPSRTISWNVSESFSETNSTDYLYSNYFIQSNNTNTITDQYKPTKVTTSVLNSNLVYTEPLSKTLALSLNYGLGLNNSSSDKESFNASTPGKYDVLDPAYSNNYTYNQLTNQLGANFNYRTTGNKTILTFGTKATSINFKQIDQFTGNIYKRSFINWNPQVLLQLRPKQNANIILQYSGGTSQPTIDQIQPIKDNSNVQSVTIGNPDLKPYFRHSLIALYSASQVITGQSMSVTIQGSMTENPITANSVTDPLTGRSTIQYVNLTNNTPYTYSVRGSMSRRIFGSVSAGLSGGVNGGTNYSFINGQLSTNPTTNYSANVNFQKNEPKKYSLSVSGGPGYSINTYSVNPSLNNSPYNFNGNASGTIYLPAKFQISSDFRYGYTASVKGAPAIYTRMLNASLSKTFLKEDNLKLSLLGNNLFDQANLSRTPTSTGFTQTSINSIKRYFMFSITWDFTKFGTIAEKK